MGGKRKVAYRGSEAKAEAIAQHFLSIPNLVTRQCPGASHRFSKIVRFTLKRTSTAIEGGEKYGEEFFVEILRIERNVEEVDWKDETKLHDRTTERRYSVGAIRQGNMKGLSSRAMRRSKKRTCLLPDFKGKTNLNMGRIEMLKKEVKIWEAVRPSTEDVIREPSFCGSTIHGNSSTSKPPSFFSFTVFFTFLMFESCYD